MILFIDPVNMKILEMSASAYSHHEADMICIPAKGNMTEFLVRNVFCDEKYIITR